MISGYNLQRKQKVSKLQNFQSIFYLYKVKSSNIIAQNIQNRGKTKIYYPPASMSETGGMKTIKL